MPVLHAIAAMWSRKQSVCSAVSGVSKGDEVELPTVNGVRLYPFAIALRVRVLQILNGFASVIFCWRQKLYARPALYFIVCTVISIVCGIGGLVLGAVGWLEERQKPALGLGVPTGAITVLAAATSIYFSRGFGGWASARSRASHYWGTPWRALGPSPCAAIPLTTLWIAAVGAHISMLVFCARSLLNIGCSSTTCIGVASAQLSLSVMTLASIVYIIQLDMRFDASLSPPPRHSDGYICTAVSMVPLTSVAVNSGNSEGPDPGSSPQGKDANEKVLLPPEPPT